MKVYIVPDRPNKVYHTDTDCRGLAAADNYVETDIQTVNFRQCKYCSGKHDPHAQAKKKNQPGWDIYRLAVSQGDD